MILDRPAIFAASLLLMGFFMTKATNGHNIDKRPPPISQPSDPQSPPTTASSTTTTTSATTTPTTTTTMTTANISNQRHRRINQNSQIPTVETSSSSIDYDDDEGENRHQNAQIPSTVLSLQDHYHKSESTSRINASQTKQDVVIPTTATATTKPHAQSILETLKQSSGVAQGIHHQGQPSAPRDFTVEGSGGGPPSSRRNQNVEKFDDTEDGNDDEDEDDEDYNDRIQESGSGRVVQGSPSSKPLESIIKPADTMGVLQPHVYRDSHKTGDNNSSSLNKSIGTTSIDQISRIPQTDDSKLVIQSTQLPPLKDLSLASPSPPTILNSMNFNSSYLSPQSSTNQPMKPIRPQQILPTTSPVLYTPSANSPANHTTKAGKNSTKNHDEYTDYDDESDDDDSEDVSNFEDNESTDEQPIVVNKTTTSHQAHHTVVKTTTTTTMRPSTKPVSQSSPQPPPLPPSTPGVKVPPPSQNTQTISTSAIALNNVVDKFPSASANPTSTTKLPDLPDSIVDDVGSDDDEDDEDEDEEDDDDNEDVIDDNIDESGGHFTSMTPPIPPSTSKATITTTSTTTATPTTTTTTTTLPPTTLPTYARIATTSATSQPASSSTLAPSQPSLLAAPTPRVFAVTKPPSSPPVPISPANRFTPIRYATTPTDRSIPASTGTSSILTYGKSSSVDDEIDLTLQLYNKAVEIYQSASNAIQSTVNSVWPPSFEARTNFLEPLMAQPLLFMLALGGAIIGLVLSMMLVVYIVSSQIEPKDDISIY